MIESIKADIWRFHPWSWIVIPTNMGWNQAGDNVMGAGVAKQAAERFPWLAREYGSRCRANGPEVKVERFEPDSKLICFPVKPLNMEMPWLSWQQDAHLGVIEESARQVAEIRFPKDMDVPVAVPLVGCGNGRLREADVLPILRKHLTSDRFILVRPL